MLSFCFWLKDLLYGCNNARGKSSFGFMTVTNGFQNARYFFSFSMGGAFT